MSADIIQFVPRPNPNREETLERMANEVMRAALYGVPHVFLTADTVWLVDQMFGGPIVKDPA